MANNYYVDLAIQGRKSDLDEMQKIFQQELDEGQSLHDYWTIHKTVKRMGFDPDKIEDCRAFTESVQRMDDNNLAIMYVGAWDEQSGLLFCIRQRWPNISISWYGIDEFGQYPHTNEPELVGKYKIEDEDEGVNPFNRLDEWVGEEAVPTINAYYGTNYKTLDECFKNINKLEHTDVMELCEESER